MKYNTDTVNTIVDAINQGKGRVNACKLAGISYDTFCRWMEEKPEFSESIKKAEEVKNIDLKETCEEIILKAAKDNTRPQWQAAAWILERKFSKEYSLKQNVDHTSGGEKLGIKLIVHGDS